jgi:peptidoglycan/LPS O-acetylase OafA/YrhL
MPEAESPARRPQIPALTSLRFFAALAIVVLHATNHALLPEAWAQRVDLSKAVSFFFVLSGFVLGYVYVGRSFSIRRFYRARWARIWPSAAVSIVIVALVLPPNLYLPPPDGPWPPGLVLLLCLLCVQALVPIPAVFFGFNAVAWCISAEAMFYLLFPWLLHQSQQRPWRLLALVLALGLGMAGLVVALRWPGFAAERLAQPVWEGLVYVNPLARLAEFVAGILAASWFVAPSRQDRLHRLRQSLVRRVSWAPAVLELLVLGCSVVVPGLVARSGWLAQAPLPLQVIVSQWIYGLGFTVLIIAVALQWGQVSRGLGWPPLVLLGEWSYGLFLYHQIVMVRWVQGPHLLLGPFTLVLPEPSFAAVLAVSVALAAMNWWLVERPAVLLLRPAG